MRAISARKVESIKDQGRHALGDGLYLLVSASARKSWVFRYQLGGQRRDMGLGSYPAVSLAEARHRRAEARRQISRGIDPITARNDNRKAAEPIPAFSEIAELVIADFGRQSTNEKVRYRAKLLLGKSYCSKLSKRPVNSISAADLAKLLNRVRAEKPETARKLHGFLSKLFETARVVLRDEHGVSIGELPTNLKDLKALGYDPRVRNEPHAALDWKEIPKFMTALRKRQGIATRALEVAVLTGLRESEVAGADWSEVNLDDRIWTIPIRRLKDRKHRSSPHRVPLSRRTAEILRDIKSEGASWVFAGLVPKNPIAPQSLLQALKSLNVGANGKPIWTDPNSHKPIVVHGFRSTLRTWAEDHGFRREAAEQSLGHAVASSVEARYRRTDILDERRKLMEAWSIYCCTGTADANVIQIRQPRG